MDSVNSGSSLHSSSGGDEEYDSRAESIAALLTTNNPHTHVHVASMSNYQSPQPPNHNHIQTHQSNSFISDPYLSNYFDPSVMVTNPNSLLHLDMVWSRTIRSDPNYSTDHNQLGQQGIEIPQVENNAQNYQINRNIVRNNPKKRSRASRRAPTTVLTTDTTNFRTMVQEFTGIPELPFTTWPFPIRTNLDHFGSASSNLRLSAAPLEVSQIQNPVLNYQPLLQTQQKYPLSNSSYKLDPKYEGNDPHIKMGVIEDQFGLVESDHQTTINNNWVDEMGSNHNSKGQNNNVGEGLLMRSINGSNYGTSERKIVNSKLNYVAASLSDIHGDNNW